MFKFDKKAAAGCAGWGLLLPMCSLWPVRTFLSLIFSLGCAASKADGV